MKKIFFLMIFAFFAVNISSCDQFDTLPDDLGKKVSSA